MPKKNSVIVDGIEYFKNPPTTVNSPIKIVILQRGWCMVGRFEKKDSDCKLFEASVIRKWGTTKGLGELAQNGPLEDTNLDPCHGLVEFDYLTVVAMISCDEKSWEGKLE